MTKIVTLNTTVKPNPALIKHLKKDGFPIDKATFIHPFIACFDLPVRK